MGPRLSIVLVAHREQGFLEPCLQSVLDGSGDEIEIVAIDDASPDHVPELLDAAATRDARVRVEHRAQRVGLGAGRQAGLELAQGEYVWFIRVTDTADPAPVLAALREDPDVLLLQHQRAAVTGGRRPGPRQSAISDA